MSKFKLFERNHFFIKIAYKCTQSVQSVALLLALAQDGVRLEHLDGHVAGLHVLQLSVGHLSVHHLDVGARNVHEVPLRRVVQQPLRLKDGAVALALLEAAGGDDGLPDVGLGVKSGAEGPAGDSTSPPPGCAMSRR